MTDVLFGCGHPHRDWRSSAEMVIEVEGPIIDSTIGGD